MKKFYRQFLSAASFLSVLLFCMLFFLSGKHPEKEINVQKITISDAKGKPCMVLDATSGTGVVSFISDDGEKTMEITGGKKPSIVMSEKQHQVVEISIIEQSKPMISLKDEMGVSRMQIQGGNSPAIFMKNPQNEIIGTMLTLGDGGAALGLADKEGDVAAFMRGGTTPSISFFQKSVEPSVALGISKGIPHLLVSSPTTKDNLVIHGGDPTSVIFVDEKGEIPVLLSKHGLFQGKKSEPQSNKPKEEKLFTWEELLEPLKDMKLN